MSQRRIIVHSLDHARAALAAAAELQRPVTLMSAAGAAGYAGVGWFKAVVEIAAAEYRDVKVGAVLDCAGEPGTVLGALRAGWRHIRFTGAPAMRDKLAALAEPLGATIEGEEAVTVLDLLDRRDAERLCRAFLAEADG